MRLTVTCLLFALATSLVFAGCGAPDLDGTASSTRSDILLDSEPAGAQGVIALRESASSDDDVVVVGRIGGSENPWVDGRAAFSIVDESLKACSDIEDDDCDKPWDYCCEPHDSLTAATALVTVVEENGDAVAGNARSLLALKELDTVVVKGIARRDDNGNLTILATRLFVRPRN